jgi:zinc/manganese transport system permease protein
MIPTWEAATIAALVAGAVGFLVVLRGSSFVAHAVPQSAFAGAAGASLIGVDTLLGLAGFAFLAALGIGWLGRRGRSDVVTALAVALLLGTGALFLSWTSAYAPAVYALLFGQIEFVTHAEVTAGVGLGVVSLLAVAGLTRPLLLAAVAADLADVRGRSGRRLELAFLALVALATTLAVPVVGSLLLFSLMVGPPAAARLLAGRPGRALILSISLSLVTAWGSVALTYVTNWPIGFFVGAGGGAWYVGVRAALGLRRTRRQRSLPPVGDEQCAVASVP